MPACTPRAPGPARRRRSARHTGMSWSRFHRRPLLCSLTPRPPPHVRLELLPHPGRWCFLPVQWCLSFPSDPQINVQMAAELLCGDVGPGPGPPGMGGEMPPAEWGRPACGLWAGPVVSPPAARSWPLGQPAPGSQEVDSQARSLETCVQGSSGAGDGVGGVGEREGQGSWLRGPGPSPHLSPSPRTRLILLPGPCHCPASSAWPPQHACPVSPGAGLGPGRRPTFHEEPVHEGALSRGRRHVLSVLLGHLHREAHLVQRPLVLPGHGLHDGREEGLGVEEAGQPHGGGQGEVCGPGLQLLRGEGSQPSTRASRQMVQLPLPVPPLPCRPVLSKEWGQQGHGGRKGLRCRRLWAWTRPLAGRSCGLWAEGGALKPGTPSSP